MKVKEAKIGNRACPKSKYKCNKLLMVTKKSYFLLDLRQPLMFRTRDFSGRKRGHYLNDFRPIKYRPIPTFLLGNNAFKEEIW